ncbi:MAG: DNA-3-methyladenine glycosylase 2 family protein [Chloroflexi bacterium]|nr:DNA-3-methyladenine glycosylase 2 family protein [Chloroflexota bacterium]
MVVRTTWRPDGPVDVPRTLSPLRHGPADPTIRMTADAVWRASRTPDGPVTMRLTWDREAVSAVAWGPGAEHAIAGVPRLLGADDDPSTFHPEPSFLRDLARRFAGLRFGRTDRVLEALVPAICEQKVTAEEAHRAHRLLALWFGERAPIAVGPGGGALVDAPRLQLPPDPALLATLPYHRLHPAGLEQRRAVVIRRVAARAPWLEAITGLSAEQAEARLRSIPGVGPWTIAETVRSALGDVDAVSVGDFHLPNLVSWALAGEPRGDDERMLELLEPYRGQRGRVVRMLELSGIRPPRFGPRLQPRSIAGI